MIILSDCAYHLRIHRSSHREHTEWKLPLSGVHSIMMEKLAQPGEGEGGCSALPFTISTIKYKVLRSTLQLRWKVRSPCFYSTPICTLWELYTWGTKGEFLHRENQEEIWHGSTYMHDLSNISRSSTVGMLNAALALKSFIFTLLLCVFKYKFFRLIYCTIYVLSRSNSMSQGAKEKFFRWLCKTCYTVKKRLVTSRLGTGKSLTFFYYICIDFTAFGIIKGFKALHNVMYIDRRNIIFVALVNG